MQGWNGLTVLDTYRDNLCLWHFIAVHQGWRVDCCTQKARELAKGFFDCANVPRNIPKTSFNQLDKVERHQNKGKKAITEWIGIRVYEPIWCEDGKVEWHLRRNPPAKLKNILTIIIYEGHAFYIKGIETLANMYDCDCPA